MDYKSIIKNDDLLKLLYNDLEKHCVQRKLSVFCLEIILIFFLTEGLPRQDIPTKMKLVEEVWLPDTGLVTDSFKLKRKAIDAFYKKQIDELYD